MQFVILTVNTELRICRSCYTKHQKLTTLNKATCHSDRSHWSNGLCQACHVAKRERYRVLKWMGLTEDKVKSLYELQKGKCGLCLTPIDQSTWRLDHDHSTGQARGLLCNRCNTGLGALGDDIEGLSKALNYLLNPPAQPLVDLSTVTLDNKIEKRRWRKNKGQ